MHDSFYWVKTGSPCNIPRRLNEGVEMGVCINSVLTEAHQTPKALPPLDSFTHLTVWRYNEALPLQSEVGLYWSCQCDRYQVEIRYVGAVFNPAFTELRKQYPGFNEILAERLSRQESESKLKGEGFHQERVVEKERVDPIFHPPLKQIVDWYAWMDTHRLGIDQYRGIFVEDGKLHLWIDPAQVYRPKQVHSESEPPDHYPIIRLDPATVVCDDDPDSLIVRADNSIVIKMEVQKVTDDLAEYLGVLQRIRDLQVDRRIRLKGERQQEDEHALESSTQRAELKQKLLEQL